MNGLIGNVKFESRVVQLGFLIEKYLVAALGSRLIMRLDNGICLGFRVSFYFLLGVTPTLPHTRNKP